MFESWVSERKNLHLRNAFLLRKAGDYPNALKELQIAVDEKDVEAQWVMHDVYVYGGFGLHPHSVLELEYSKPKWTYDKRNPELRIQGHDREYLEYAAECGNAHSQWLIGNCQNGWNYEADKQKHTTAMGFVCSCFLNGCCICFNHYTVLDIAHKNIDIRRLPTMCIALQRTLDPELRLQELYIYGKFLVKDIWRLNIPKEEEEAKRIYRETTEKSQKAVLYWLWISKQFVVPDVRRLIGQMVWESRTRPEEWIEKENKNKKQKI